MSQPRNAHKRQRIQARTQRRQAKRRALRRKRASGRRTVPADQRQGRSQHRAGSLAQLFSTFQAYQPAPVHQRQKVA
jgi:hypothetical protein